jgi:hypothetical protein
VVATGVVARAVATVAEKAGAAAVVARVVAARAEAVLGVAMEAKAGKGAGKSGLVP